MSSEAITRNDLTAILNEVLPPTPSEYRKLLWTNPNPTSAMSSVTIVASGADEYDAIEVVYKTAHIYNGYETALAPFVAGSHITLLAPSGTGGEFSGAIYNAVRTISMGAGGSLMVDDAIGMTSSGTTVNNNMCIPYKVYGIKYERVEPPQLETPIIQTLTVTAQTDANGYFHPPTSLNDAIPIWAEVSGRPTGLRPCFLTNGYTETERYGLRFKAWNDVVAYTSTTITVTIYYIKLVN